jgi:hypothetical protein
MFTDVLCKALLLVTITGRYSLEGSFISIPLAYKLVIVRGLFNPGRVKDRLVS